MLLNVNMVDTQPLLQIKPEHELKFRGPFNVPVTSYMKITNPTDKKVSFKIKTTAPKKYCVRPNGSILDPKQTIEIAVSLQPLETEEVEKSKHKFMVQAIMLPNGDYNLETLWRDSGTDLFWNNKLKCVFESGEPIDTEVSSPVLNSTQTPESKKPAVADAGIPPKTSSDEIQKAAKEVIHLREELSSMRQENFQLKEELVKLRTQYAVSQPTAQNNTSFSRDHSQLVDSSQLTPMVYLACGVIVGLLSVVIGKYIF